jgi:hypothetical protein
VVVEVRNQPTLQYELRHRRLAAEARRELRRLRIGPASPTIPLAGDLPIELVDLVEAAETAEWLDRDI